MKPQTVKCRYSDETVKERVMGVHSGFGKQNVRTLTTLKRVRFGPVRSETVAFALDLVTLQFAARRTSFAMRSEISFSRLIMDASR